MNLAGQLRPIVAALAVWAATALAVRAEEANDYPTAARAEYVYGCMKANGESPAGDRAMFLLDRRGGLDRIL
ncbi:hypothetical protein ACVW0I_005881 [Bradyrhizobium sp. LM6.11]